MVKVRIDRSKWNVPENVPDNCQQDGLLLNHDGLMCCLGFLGKACGVPREKLLDIGTPENTYNPYRENKYSKWPKGILNRESNDSRLTMALVKANDSVKLSSTKRESRIRELGRKIGVKFEFYGKFRKVRDDSK